MKGLDLRNFKKISGDDKKAVFRHKDGHEITIARKGLSKEMLKSLDALPNYDDGGSVTPEDSAAAQQAFDDANPSHMPDDFHNSDAPQGAPADTPPEGAWQMPQTPDVAALPQSDQVQQTAASPSPALQPQQGSANQQAPLTPDAFSAGARTELSQLQQGEQGYNASLNKQADLAKQQGDVAASEAMARATKLQDMQTAYQKSHDELTSQRQALIQDIQAGHIDPNHYMENMGSGKKVATAIGLILGGIGGGITGQPNPALEFLHRQIDRDIEAQKADLGKKENLLNANFRATGDLNDALNLTRVNLADIYSTQLQRQAAQMQGPMAQAIAQQAAGELQMKVAPEIGQLTQKMALGKMLQQMDGQQMAPEQKVQLYQMTGVMSPEEAKATMAEIQNRGIAENERTNILNSANKIFQKQSLGNRTTDPIQSKQQIDNLNAAIKLAIRKKYGAGHGSESMMKIMDNLTAGITTVKTTQRQMMSTLNNIFGQEEVYPYMKKWGLNPAPQAYNQNGESAFQLGAGPK